MDYEEEEDCAKELESVVECDSLAESDKAVNQPMDQALASVLWACHSCTFKNSVACSWCGMCGARVQPGRIAKKAPSKRSSAQPLQLRTPTKRARKQPNGAADNCAICMEALRANCSTTQCGHSFHIM